MPRHLYVVLLLFLFGPMQAFAVDVQVDVAETGKDATEARIKALSSADKLAFAKLVTGKLGMKAEEFLKAYTPEAISQMVQGYEIVEESMTPNSYKATMKVKFGDSILNKIPTLSSATGAVIPAEKPAIKTIDSKTILILPVWLDAKGIILWEEINPWREALSKAALQVPGNHWVTATGDPADRVYVDASNVSSAGFAQLAPLAERYGAGQVLIAIAHAGAGNLEVELRHLSATGEEKENMQLAADAPESATLEDLMQRAADELLLGDNPAALTKGQKKAIAMDTPEELQEINMMLNLTRARDWAELNHRLQTIPGVEGLQVVSADWQRMKVRMAYRGKPEKLGEELAKAGLNVQQEADMLLLTIR